MSIPKNAITRVVNSDISQYLSVLAGDPEPIVLEMEAYAREKDFPLVGRSSGRWLELRFGDAGLKVESKTAGIIAVTAMLLIGLILVFYREPL